MRSPAGSDATVPAFIRSSSANNQQTSARASHCRIEVRIQTLVRLVLDISNAAEAFRVIGDQLLGAVGQCIVGNDELALLGQLSEDAIDRRAEEFRALNVAIQMDNVGRGPQSIAAGASSLSINNSRSSFCACVIPFQISSPPRIPSLHRRSSPPGSGSARRRCVPSPRLWAL